MTKNSKKRNRYERPVASIQEVALSNTLGNGVVRELTYQQALSIHLRSRQLARENEHRGSGLPSNEYERQVNHCYHQRSTGKDISTPREE